MLHQRQCIAHHFAFAQRLGTHQQAEQPVRVAVVTLASRHHARHGLRLGFNDALMAQHTQR